HSCERASHHRARTREGSRHVRRGSESLPECGLPVRYRERPAADLQRLPKRTGSPHSGNPVARMPDSPTHSVRDEAQPLRACPASRRTWLLRSRTADLECGGLTPLSSLLLNRSGGERARKAVSSHRTPKSPVRKASQSYSA